MLLLLFGGLLLLLVLLLLFAGLLLLLLILLLLLAGLLLLLLVLLLLLAGLLLLLILLLLLAGLLLLLLILLLLIAGLLLLLMVLLLLFAGLLLLLLVLLLLFAGLLLLLLLVLLLLLLLILLLFHYFLQAIPGQFSIGASAAMVWVEGQRRAIMLQGLTEPIYGRLQRGLRRAGRFRLSLHGHLIGSITKVVCGGTGYRWIVRVHCSLKRACGLLKITRPIRRDGAIVGEHRIDGLAQILRPGERGGGFAPCLPSGGIFGDTDFLVDRPLRRLRRCHGRQ